MKLDPKNPTHIKTFARLTMPLLSQIHIPSGGNGMEAVEFLNEVLGNAADNVAELDTLREQTAKDHDLMTEAEAALGRFFQRHRHPGVFMNQCSCAGDNCGRCVEQRARASITALRERIGTTKEQS